MAAQRTSDCAALLRELDRAHPEARAALLERAVVPDDYSELARALGLYPLTRYALASGVQRWEADTRATFQDKPHDGVPAVRYAPPAAEPMSRRTVAGVLARARFDPLGQVRLSDRELFDLAAAYAPSFEIAVAGDYDRFGALRWLRAGDMPQIDASQLTVYVHSGQARFGETVLLQLVYTIWFPERPALGTVDFLAGRLDAVMWRVTLAPDGEPLLYDSIHACGCYHLFFPTPRARPRPAPDALEEWAFVPQALPRVPEGARPRIRLASATHYIEGVELVRGTDSLTRYAFRALRRAALAAERCRPPQRFRSRWPRCGKRAPGALVPLAGRRAFGRGHAPMGAPRHRLRRAPALRRCRSHRASFRPRARRAAMSKSLRVVTLNIHKGLSHFNRRMVIHELRDGLTALDPDVVFLQEVQGLNQRFTLRFRTCPIEPQHEFLAGDRWQPVYGCNAVYDHGHHGNAILSRFPFVSFENHDVSDHRFERRGLLHCVVAVPRWRRNLHLVCVHLSLHERGRSRQLEAISGRLEELASRDVPIIIAGDFNDWRHRATAILERRLGMTEVSVAHHGRPMATFPSMMPLLRLDRIYVRGFRVNASTVHKGKPWSMLSDHLAVSAELERA